MNYSYQLHNNGFDLFYGPEKVQVQTTDPETGAPLTQAQAKAMAEALVATRNREEADRQHTAMLAQREAFTAAIQAHLDNFAQTRNYDGILSAATYATDVNPKFKAEGQYAVEARSATWAKAYAILDEVMSGQRPMPSLEEVLAELPTLSWPV